MADRGAVNHAPSGRDEEIRRAEFRARSSPSGIGATLVLTRSQGEEHIWECIVSDGHEWHYVRVIGRDLGSLGNVAPEDIEEGIERFAASLPEPRRIRHLLNANPLHIDRQGHVED